MLIRLIRFCSLFVLLASDSRGAQAEPAEELPNIVIFLADDLGWNDIGYHNPEIRTPNLDQLASESVVLDHYYVQPECTPTRVALLTGRYPNRFGEHCSHASNERALPPGTLTLASALQSVGYDTGLFGKWHLGSRPEWGPQHYGFEYSYGSLPGAVGMYDHRYRLNNPFTQAWHRNGQFIEDEQGHATDLIVREVVDWLNRPRTGPYFLYVPFHAVHTPLVEPQSWLDHNRHIESADRRLFAAAVSHLDDAIGKIVAEIDKLGPREETLLIFFSDNGAQVHHAGDTYPPPDPRLRNFSSNEPLRGRKGQTYEGGIRVPAFVQWKGKLEPGESDAVMHAIDWLPTLSGLVGHETESDPNWDGLDVWPQIEGGPQTEPRLLYWNRGNHQLALRDGDWKIARQRPNDPWSLFNLADDPYEKENVAAEMPEKVQQLEEQLRAERAKDGE